MTRRTLSNELFAAGAAFMLMMAVTLPVRGDTNCSDAAACGDALDEGNPGDNQAGDSGSDREPSGGKRP